MANAPRSALISPASIAIVLSASLGFGCQVRSQGYAETPPPAPVETAGAAGSSGGEAEAASTPTQVAQPHLEQGVTIVETSCTEGAEEQCNGLDDNCNGEIDEGCGYQSGSIQVTLAWNTGSDIDLYVTDPAGETISFAHKEAASGGIIDHDARGNCRPNQANNRIENGYWKTDEPPSGTYQVALHYYGDCNSGAGPTQATVSIAVGGQVIGAYTYTLNVNQKVTVATFNIP